MRKHFVTIFVCLLGYVASYAMIVRSDPMPMMLCGSALGEEPFTMPLKPDYRFARLNPILTQFYKPIHLVDAKLRPSYWQFEFAPHHFEAAIEVETF